MAFEKENGVGDLTPLVRDGIVFSPYPDCELPRCSMYSYVKQRLIKFHDKVAMIEGDRSVTSSQLLDTYQRYAAGFQSHGVNRGDKICCLLNKSMDNSIALSSAIFAGGAIVLCSPLHRKGELLANLRRADVCHVLTDAPNAGMVKELQKEMKFKSVFVIGEERGFISVPEFRNIPATAFQEVPVSDPENELAAITFSSGTTGPPKAMQVTHYGFVSSIAILASQDLLDPSDVYLVFESSAHVFGVLFTTFAIYCGAVAVFIPLRPSHATVAAAINRFKVTALSNFPARLQTICTDMMETGERFDSVKKILFTGGPMTPNLADMVKSQFSLSDFRNLYGFSESLNPVTLTPPHDICMTDVGFVAPNMQIKVIDTETGETLGPRKHGELYIRTPTATSGYYVNDQGVVPAVDQDGWLPSGDLGFYREDGRFQIVDRLKSIIKFRDYTVVPHELEEVLLTHPLVSEAVVVGTPHSQYFEAPTAFVVRKKQNTGVEVSEEELKELVASQLAPYKHLTGGLFFVDNIPTTENGKVSREMMKQRFIASMH